MIKNITARRVTMVVGILILLFILFCMAFSIFDNSFMYTQEVQRYPGSLGDYEYLDHGDYKINPATILLALNHGDTNVFMPELATPEVWNWDGSIIWHYSDYLKIARALNQFVWKDNLDNWNIYRIFFQGNYSCGINGFVEGDFTYYKTIIHTDGTLGYTTREIDIHPLDNEVSWGGGAGFPLSIPLWASTKLQNLKINPEDALNIAEKNGGEAYRLARNNDCKISLVLFDNWNVYYDLNKSGLNAFKIYIDPYTGNILKTP